MLTYTTAKNVPGYEQLKKNLCNMPEERIQKNIKKFDDFLSSNKKFLMANDNKARMTRDCVKECKNMFTEAIETRFPQCVKENEARFVNKNLPKNSNSTIDKPSEINYINNTNETKTNNSKGDKTMENKINELLTLVKHLTARIESLETGNRPQIKKLRERKDEAPKAIVKKVAATADKSEILKLQKKVREGEKTLTKKQLTQYNFFYGQEWRKINKTIDLNDKLARSMAFTKARLSCLKKAKTF